jgi:hypothetical protein
MRRTAKKRTQRQRKDILDPVRLERDCILAFKFILPFSDKPRLERFFRFAQPAEIRSNGGTGNDAQ